MRVEMNPRCLVPAHVYYETFLLREMEALIVEQQARIVIVDNITYLRDELDKGRNAGPLMQELQDLASRRSLSLKTLAHTPKRDDARPVTLNDLANSKMLSNFSDAVFAIGKSHVDPSLRYLKQLKARNSEMVYHAEHVALVRLEKAHNFLHFEFAGYGAERDHLAQRDAGDSSGRRVERAEQAQTLAAQGKSQREIAARLGVSVGAVNSYLKA